MKNSSKTIKIIFGFLVLGLTTACSKDDPTAPIPNSTEAVYRIKQKTIASNGNVINYEYTPQNQISKITYPNGKIEKYNYNSQGVLLSFQVSGNPPGGPNNYTANYLYNTTGIKTEELFNNLDDAGQPSSKQKIEYQTNTQGLPTKTTYYNWNSTNSLWVLSNYFVSTYNDKKQLLKNDYYNSTGFSTLNYSFTYDSKGNKNESKEYQRKPDNSFYLSYQFNVTFDDKKAIQNFNGQSDANNTIDMVSKTFAVDGSVSNQNSATQSYEYNEAGYVTKIFYNGVLSATYNLEKVN